EDYAQEFSEYRKAQRVDEPAFRREAISYWHGRVETKRRQTEAALLPVIPSTPAAELPVDPIFGYVDARDGHFFIRAHSRDRVWVSGWVASARSGTPVRELKLNINGQELGTVHDFYPRPDVAAHFGHPNLLHSGWQVLVYLPSLRPGRYDLIVEATDREGIRGTLAPWPVEIVA